MLYFCVCFGLIFPKAKHIMTKYDYLLELQASGELFDAFLRIVKPVERFYQRNCDTVMSPKRVRKESEKSPKRVR